MAFLAGQKLRASELAPGPWQPVTFVNGWTNLGGTWSTVAYRKHPTGLVELRGACLGGTIANGTTLYVLPTGYRPTAGHEAHAVANLTSGSADPLIRILSTGEVQIYGMAASTNGAHAQTGIFFDAG